jgi:hypothetical protein
MAISRNRSAGAKVTDEEYARLEMLAQARGLTMGELVSREYCWHSWTRLRPRRLSKRFLLRYWA